MAKVLDDAMTAAAKSVTLNPKAEDESSSSSEAYQADSQQFAQEVGGRAAAIPNFNFSVSNSIFNTLTINVQGLFNRKVGKRLSLKLPKKAP